MQQAKRHSRSLVSEMEALLKALDGFIECHITVNSAGREEEQKKLQSFVQQIIENKH